MITYIPDWSWSSLVLPAIELENVSVIYRRRKGMRKFDDFVALKDLSLTVNQGENLGVIGRNGVGKSTLLRLLAGIYEPNEGVVKRYSQRVSLLSLQVGFDINLSGLDNIFISGMLLGFSKGEIKENVSKIVEYSELGEFIQQPVKTYSSGMRARLGFSICHHMSPDVLLVDEALSVGDAGFRAKAEQAMLDKSMQNSAMVLVSHAGAQIRRLCNRVVWIENHQIKMDGTPDEVMPEYNRYLAAQ